MPAVETANGELPPQSLIRRLQELGQEHLLGHWPSLEDAQRSQLLKELQDVDFDRVVRIFQSSTQAADTADEVGACDLLPVDAFVDTLKGRSHADTERWRSHGLQAIAEGQLALLLLAGGQGTRLGSSDPKGCYDIGLPSRKSLFQLQAERIQRVQSLAAQHIAGDGANAEVQPTIPWYIMTSPFTHERTQEFFEEHNFFGLSSDQVVFFQQGTLPCFSPSGKLLLQSPFQLASAPDGNGGVYAALKTSGSLADMSARGVRFVECVSVDNALVRVADPLFLGRCLENDAKCAAKAVQKAYPQERVGVFVLEHPSQSATRPLLQLAAVSDTAGASGDRRSNGLRSGPSEQSTAASADAAADSAAPAAAAQDISVAPAVDSATVAGRRGADGAAAGGGRKEGHIVVKEYSELPPDMASRVNAATGELLFNWSNVCMHMFSLDFLVSVSESLERDAKFHVARKKVPSVDGPVDGVKLEQFIFDVLPYAPSVRLFEVSRAEEFSPVKNGPDSSVDSPVSARAHMLSLHTGWVERAGGRVEEKQQQQQQNEEEARSEVTWGVEVSPLLSYAGEGLEDLCSEVVFSSGFELSKC